MGFDFNHHLPLNDARRFLRILPSAIDDVHSMVLARLDQMPLPSSILKSTSARHKLQAVGGVTDA